MKESAVSEIVGAVILVALVIGGIGLVSVVMTSSSPPEAMTKAVLSGACERCPDEVSALDGESQYYAIMISHEGGESVDPATLRYLVDTKENPGIFHEVYVSDYFDSTSGSLADIKNQICLPPGYVGPVPTLIPTGDKKTLKVGDAARIWFNMAEYDWGKPKSVQILSADKRYETSMTVPEFRVIAKEEEFDDPPEYLAAHPTPAPTPGGGTGGTGQPSEPTDPSAVAPVFVKVCKCVGDEYLDDKKETCVAQFTYQNSAGKTYMIPIREGGVPWNEFSGSGMVEQFRCQPKTFTAPPGEPFWTNRFWNNIKWKLGHEQSVLVKCEKNTPTCEDIGEISSEVCEECKNNDKP